MGPVQSPPIIIHPPVPSQENPPREPVLLHSRCKTSSRHSLEYILTSTASRVAPSPRPRFPPPERNGPDAQLATECSSSLQLQNPTIEVDAGRTVFQQYLDAGFDEFDNSPFTGVCNRLPAIHQRRLQHNLSFAQGLIVLFQRPSCALSDTDDSSSELLIVVTTSCRTLRGAPEDSIIDATVANSSKSFAQPRHEPGPKSF
jgi:hypothetical protein